MPRLPGLRVKPAGSGGIVGRQDRRTASPSAAPTRRGARVGLLPAPGAAELHGADPIRHQALPSSALVWGGRGRSSPGPRPRPITDRRGRDGPLASLVFRGVHVGRRGQPATLDPRPVGHICPGENGFDGGQRMDLGGPQGWGRGVTILHPPKGQGLDAPWGSSPFGCGGQAV